VRALCYLPLSPAVYSLLSTLFVGLSVAFAFEKLLVYHESVGFADARES
jgi:hypothetical protein